MPRARRAVSARRYPTGPPRFWRGRSGAYDSRLKARNIATAPPVRASASRTRCRPAGTDATGFRAAITPPPGLGLLHLEDEGENDRPAIQPLEIPAQGLANLFLDLGRVGPRLGVDRPEGVQHLAAGLLEDFGTGLLRDHPPGDQIRAGDDLPGLLLDGKDGQYQTVLGEVAPVAEDHVAHLADALAVDEDAPRGDALRAARAPARIEREDVAVLQEVAAAGRDADLAGEVEMAHEVAVLPVHRHEVPRPDQVQDQLQLLLRGVARDVDRRVAAVVDDRPAAIEVVHQARDGALVPRDDARRQHDDVARRERHLLVVVHGDADQRRRRLGLAAR